MRRPLEGACLLVILFLGCEGPYGPDGYNSRGYNFLGYDRYGYDKKGYDSWGRARPEGTPTPATEVRSIPERDVFGTGFAICNGEYVLTTFDVIRDANEASVTVEFPGGEPTSATITMRSFVCDAALLKLARAAPSHLTFADPNATKLGQPIYTLGYPAANVRSNRTEYTHGTITSLSGIVDDVSWMRVSAPARPGSEGGPVLDASGNIVGMIISKATVRLFGEFVGTVPEDTTWAVKAAHVLPILPAQCIPAEDCAEPPGDKSVEETKKAVCMIRVRKPRTQIVGRSN